MHLAGLYDSVAIRFQNTERSMVSSESQIFLINNPICKMHLIREVSKHESNAREPKCLYRPRSVLDESATT